VDAREIERVEALERQAVEEIKRAFVERTDDIAAILIEPIQAEGGDNHFRPEFMRALRQLADENDALLIFDEVQSGVGLTGRFWAHQHTDVRPDLLAFGKKMQVCGMLAGPRIDEEPDNVFKVSSRLNSTWGGNLVDMVRSQRYLEIMVEDDLLHNTTIMGKSLLDGLTQITSGSDLISNVRGRGAMIAFDLPDPRARDIFRGLLLENGLVALKCGTRSIRFRPMLDLDASAVEEGLGIVEKSLYDSRRDGAQL
jgi:L-lysine 6-transaminase